jgi:membrane associated rhomboid family serine protease
MFGEGLIFGYFGLNPWGLNGFIVGPWQLVTYGFLHQGFLHIFFNLFILWMFGPDVERQWGTRYFLYFYFFCLVGAGLTNLGVIHIFNSPPAITVGASGAIYGVLMAYGILFPDNILLVAFILPMRAKTAVWFFGIIALAFGVSATRAAATGQYGGVQIAHFAHLGGLLAGYLFIKFPLWWNYSQQAYTYFSTSRNKRRRGKKAPFEFKTADDLQDEVDRILEKISAKGVDSLTADEHKTMKKYADKKK